MANYHDSRNVTVSKSFHSLITNHNIFKNIYFKESNFKSGSSSSIIFSPILQNGFRMSQNAMHYNSPEENFCR